MSDTMEWFLFDVVGTILAVFGVILFLWVLSKQIPKSLNGIVLDMYHDAEGMGTVLAGITIFLIILGLYLIDVYFLQ